MLSHVHIGTDNLPAAAAFYTRVLEPLGLVRSLMNRANGPDGRCKVAIARFSSSAGPSTDKAPMPAMAR
jgi:hypothetical protein